MFPSNLELLLFVLKYNKSKNIQHKLLMSFWFFNILIIVIKFSVHLIIIYDIVYMFVIYDF